jgi:membrane protease YdiL (CAAX protease family)
LTEPPGNNGHPGTPATGDPAPTGPSAAPSALPPPGSAALPPPGSAAVPVPGPPGIGTFSLEGRAAPALYLLGWVGSLIGLGMVVIALMASGSDAAGWLFLIGLAILGLALLAAGGSQAVERARRSDLAYRGPSPVLAFLAVLAVTLVLFVLILAPLAAMGLDARSPAATTLSLVITAAVYVGVVQLLVVGPGALSWSDMGLAVPAGRAVSDLLVGALVAVPVLVVTLSLVALLSRFLEPELSPLPEAVDTVGLIANLLSAAVIAPVSEELFFRGFATTAWARSLGYWPAIIRGAAFFAVAHVIAQLDVSFASGAQRALFSFVALLPVAVTLGWLYLARRSLYASIGLHAAFNAIQVIALFAATAAAAGAPS